jgi:hypothetical protein
MRWGAGGSPLTTTTHKKDIKLVKNNNILLNEIKIKLIDFIQFYS